MRIGPSSLRSRLALLFAVATAALLLGGAAMLYVVLDRQLSAAIDQGLVARSADLAGVMDETGAAIPDEDPFAQVLRGDGRVIDQSPTAATPEPVLTPDEVAAIRGPTTFERDVKVLGGPARLRARPVQLDTGHVVLVVGSSVDAYERSRERLALVLAISTPLLVGFVAWAGWMLAGAALRPVQRMTDEADAIAITELGRRLDVPSSHDEIEQLARTLNAMLDRIEEAVAHERRFLDDASHELRTPLSILRGELELALARPDDPTEVQASLRSALDEAIRLGRMADDLLALARARAGGADVQARPVELLAAARRVSAALEVPSGVDVLCVGDDVRVVLDADKVDRVLLNLVANALRHARTRVEVRVGATAAGADLLVADDGPGFAPSLLPVRFERFTRPDPARGRDTGGTGLGLAIVASLVKAHGAEITAGNGPPLGGGWVRVQWADVGSDAPSDGPSDSPARAAGRTTTDAVETTT